MTTAEYLRDVIFPASFALLPSYMDDSRAKALLLTIALQESKCEHRVQIQGPAKSFYQFERAGVKGVFTHPSSAPYLPAVLRTMRVLPTVGSIYDAIEHNDILATVCARLLLWTLPDALPDEHDAVGAWAQYLDAWRPGKPHQHTWPAHFDHAWRLLNGTPEA